MEFNYSKIEEEIKAFWASKEVYKVKNDTSKPKYYVLDMFPYPSGAGLHVGHPLGYIGSDILSRYKRMKGFNVLHPMGYDSFGLPAEQYAIQTGQHPAVTTEQNIKRYREQLDKIGFSFDWSRQVKTSDPKYYKWTQWIFIQLFKSWYNKTTDKAEYIENLVKAFEANGSTGINAHCSEHTPFTAIEWGSWSEKQQQEMLLNYRLAYLADSWVNWCPALGTVLANDEVKDGVSERGGYPVEQRLMKQWSLRITAYSERLLQGLNGLEWPESLKESQRNWIGRSEGARVKFQVSSPTNSPLLRRGAGGEVHGNDEDKVPHYYTGNPEMTGYLIEEAKSNRKNPTPAEELLWEEIRNNKLNAKFRRQHYIGNYIVDFVCLSKKLVVELDGEVHKSSQEHDENRTKYLNSEGYTVIRFWNAEVINKTAEVIAKIKEALSKLPDLKDLTPGPSPKERGTDAGGLFIEVFTTRPDTIFGVTFMVLAPEHELVKEITTPARKDKIEAYIKKAGAKSERERNSDVKNVSGEFTGAYVVHPFTGKDIPIYIADYVLATYGTGAVMAVPSGDSRDFRFAKHFNLPIVNVFQGVDESALPYEEKAGKIDNSDFLNGLEVPAAMRRAIDEIERKGIGEGKVNYRQRDAIFGRQRYWGEPIPVYYKDGVPYTVGEKDLPVVLPEIDKYLPTETGEPPLARAKDWTYSPNTPTPALPPRGRENESPFFFTANSSGWKYLSEFAKQHRDNPTPAEKIVWERVRNHQLDEHIRQQHIIGNFIVDFVCLNKGLIIEIDGDIHDLKKEEDEARENYLKELGYAVIRFANEQVISDTNNVIDKIKENLSSLPDNFFSVQESKASTLNDETSSANEEVSPLGGDLEGVKAEAYPLELTTMPGWAGSSWYYLRYMDPHNDKAFAGKEALDYWKDVDFYIGGSEHATGHLLYFRFWTKFLHDTGYISIDEPAKKMVNQGMIQGVSAIVHVSNTYNSDVENSIEVYSLGKIRAMEQERQEYYKRIEEQFPKDKRRIVLHESNWEPSKPFAVMYTNHIPSSFCDSEMVAIEQLKEWNDDFKNAKYHLEENGNLLCERIIEKMSKSKYNVVNPDDVIGSYGADCFRMYEMFLGPIELSKPWDTQGIDGVSRFLRKLWRMFYNELDGKWLVTDEAANNDELKVLHKTIKKVNEDIEKLAFNTSVSAFMVCVNELASLKCNKKSILEPLVSLLHPFAPFTTEFLWRKLGHTDSILNAPFPIADESLLVENSYEYPVSVNGKVRTKLHLPLELQQADVEKEVMALDIVQKWLEGKAPKKVIYVKGRMINVVV